MSLRRVALDATMSYRGRSVRPLEERRLAVLLHQVARQRIAGEAHRHILDGNVLAVARDNGTIEVARTCAARPARRSGRTRSRSTRRHVLAVASEVGFAHLWRSRRSCAFDRSLIGPGGPSHRRARHAAWELPCWRTAAAATRRGAEAFARRAACAPGGAWLRVWSLRDLQTHRRPADRRHGGLPWHRHGRRWLAATVCGDISDAAPVCGPARGPIARWPLDNLDGRQLCLRPRR